MDLINLFWMQFLKSLMVYLMQLRWTTDPSHLNSVQSIKTNPQTTTNTPAKSVVEFACASNSWYNTFESIPAKSRINVSFVIRLLVRMETKIHMRRSIIQILCLQLILDMHHIGINNKTHGTPNTVLQANSFLQKTALCLCSNLHQNNKSKNCRMWTDT